MPPSLARLISRLTRRGPLPLVVAFVAVAGLAAGLWFSRPQAPSVPYSGFAQALGAGQVERVTIGESGLTVTSRAGASSHVKLPAGWLDTAFLDRLAAAGVEVSIERQDFDAVGVAGLLASLLMMGMVAFVLTSQLDLRGRLNWPAVARDVTQRFADVAGQDEAKAELAEIVTFLKDRASFSRVGARPPRGVLMVGPPGTGKTLLARALAGEAGVTFMAVAGSEFSAAFVGVSKSRVARLFREARRRAPCILFIDEIDSLGKKRAAGASAADREYDTTLNQLLVEMDGFDATDDVIVVGATNRVDVLDPALLRPGRFDRHVQIGLPDVGGREGILRVHGARVPLSSDVDLRIVARGTPGFSGADLGNLVNEAAVLAARDGSKAVTAAHFDGARRKIIMGLERRSLVLDEEERHLVAVHEAGHALCATRLPAADRVQTATIVPHGGALGMVMRLPEKDRLCVPLDKLKTDLVVAMGGRAAEEAVFGPDRITTGAASDIGFATDLARRMVTEWGMSPTLGMMRVDAPDGVLPEQAREAMRQLVEDAYSAARAIMVERRDALDRLTRALLQKETLSGAEVEDLVHRPAPAQDGPVRVRVTVEPASLAIRG